MESITVTSPEATMAIGAKLGQLVQPGDLILLDGDLGAGKTTFTKGLAKNLGIPNNVKSPTFTLIREYRQGRLPLYHMDVYRLEDGGAEDLGLDEYFDGDGVSVVEWSQFIADLLPPTYLRIAISRDTDADDQRVITFKPIGEHYQRLVDQLKE
ncbi:tRNA (adenosine(37)-N6)-threonylcarbamoyltransferase complex ATPase subunit type 1 TsaE [Lactiplantibacillus plantarum]|uniref:tRNA (adenosine(37)-N6)-threonylcarbamoyltransferase complex ATPase subunit type 1 TsaE n=1 Tax=Lactiplantibacillus plantarum TaxID=1590 RepID=UPI001A92DBB4|nr:tRNA (adenosine(37)-N6)-threonylcarbamoyltransferase complex ATPase subunit type 1 TsaE [Lactiplantibacillus plantarum]QSW67546.1 tRNA (adenosine(37)-N6)-threonylcarbamoyltransferase complex ATPase subunit type 1 TsaE [Lactiplantibacillus plantarum]